MSKQEELDRAVHAVKSITAAIDAGGYAGIMRDSLFHRGMAAIVGLADERCILAVDRPAPTSNYQLVALAPDGQWIITRNGEVIASKLSTEEASAIVTALSRIGQ